MTRRKPPSPVTSAVVKTRRSKRKGEFTIDAASTAHARALDRAGDLQKAIAMMRTAEIDSVVFDGSGMAERALRDLASFALKLETAIRTEMIRRSSTGLRG